MFNLITLLPRLFSTSQAILACIQGGPTKEELREAVQELHNLLRAVPALAGVLAMFETVVRVVDKVLPDLLGDPQWAKDVGLDADTVQQAAGMTTLYKAVMEKAIDGGQIKPHELVQASDVDGMV
jgi:queuine/archaeosine tRNA-ribosyltransferase